ncbi:MAG: hypothetical protein F4Y68_03615 [Boseongicola sp. SB0665_bin_10]|nr:hypothetical protein [Boseongicola sp. SB0665_bin_10]
MKSNASIVHRGVISFGHAIQDRVREDNDQADELYRAVADAIARWCGAEVLGLVAHEDETAPHAHFWMDAYDKEGKSVAMFTFLNQRLIPDIAAKAAQKFIPEIERGKPRRQRIADGDDPKTYDHRSPRKMREDLGLPPSASADEVSAAVHRKREAEAASVKIMSEVERAIAHVAAIQEVTQGILSGEFRLMPGRAWSRGRAASAAGWKERKAELEALELPDDSWKTLEALGHAMYRAEMFATLDEMIHSDRLRMGPDKEWQRGANMKEVEWPELKSFFEKADLPAALWRRLDAAAASARRRRESWGEQFALPVLAAGIAALDPEQVGHWKGRAAQGEWEGVLDDLEGVGKQWGVRRWAWAVDLARLLDDPSPDNVARFRERSRNLAMATWKDRSARQSAGADHPDDVATASLPGMAGDGEGDLR